MYQGSKNAGGQAMPHSYNSVTYTSAQQRTDTPGRRVIQTTVGGYSSFGNTSGEIYSSGQSSTPRQQIISTCSGHYVPASNTQVDYSRAVKYLSQQGGAFTSITAGTAYQVQPSLNQPSLNQPTLNQPISNQLTINQPSLNQPTLNQPISNQLTINQPSLNQPSLNQPSLNQPSLNQPSLNQPSLNQPISSQPVSNRTQDTYRYTSTLKTLQTPGMPISALSQHSSTNGGSGRVIHMPEHATLNSPAPTSSKIIQASQNSENMDQVFKNMSMANEQIRTLVQESDKLIGAAKQFKKGLDQRTAEYLVLKEEIDQLKTEMRTIKEQRSNHQIQSALKQKQNTDTSQAFTVQERDQLLEIIELQRIEIEKLTAKKKKKRAVGDELVEDLQSNPAQKSMGDLHSTLQTSNADDLVNMVKPKPSKKSAERTPSRQQVVVITNSMELQPSMTIKPKRKSTENTSTRKYR